MPTLLTLNKAIQKAKNIKPNWIAVDKDGHIYAHIDKPRINTKLGCWLSMHKSWDIGFFKKPEDWENTLRKIHYG